MGSARRSTRSFPHNGLQLETLVFLIQRLLDGKKSLEAPFVDIIRCPHLEDSRKKENARSDHRPNFKANGGCYAAKNIQYGLVTRYPRLKFSPSTLRVIRAASAQTLQGGGNTPNWSYVCQEEASYAVYHFVRFIARRRPMEDCCARQIRHRN
jgi:hypothetical protein